MSNYIDNTESHEISENGLLVGEMKPCHETKWMGWKIYFYKGNISALISDIDGSCGLGGERITIDELEMYCDDDVEQVKNKIYGY